MDQTDIAEFDPEVIEAEAEVVAQEVAVPPAPTPAPVSSPVVTEELVSDEVNEAAVHAAAIIESMPDPMTFGAITEEPAQSQEEAVEEATPSRNEETPRDLNLTKSLEEAREEAILNERTEAADEDAAKYAEQREDELELQVEAEHEQWSPDQLDNALDALKQ